MVMFSLQLKANGYINKSKGHFGTHLHSAFQHMSTMQHAKKTLYIKYYTVILTYCIGRISDKWNNTLLPFHKMRSKRQYTHSCFTLALLASQSQDKDVALRNLQPSNEVAFEKIQAKVAKKKDIEKPNEIHEACSSWHLSNLSDLSDCFERAHIFKTKLSAFAAAFGLEATGGRDTTSPKQCLHEYNRLHPPLPPSQELPASSQGLPCKRALKKKQHLN